MTESKKDPYAAGEQGLGYIYQPRLALLKLLQLPEKVSVLIEKDDDLDFVDDKGVKTLASLKHKAKGERLTDLSKDFWKSLNIWLTRYNRDGRTECMLRFFMFTTSKVSKSSFLTSLLPDAKRDPLLVLEDTNDALSKTSSKTITSIRDGFSLLDDNEQMDFLSRIMIFDDSPRIEDLPVIIKDQYMRTVRREFRQPVYERLEGWWNDLTIKLLTGERTTEVSGFEVSDKLSSITDQYKTDNLPINFSGEKPEDISELEDDSRLFVMQLKEIGIKPNRIRNAIYDYYRAFEQRSSWARENVLVEGEVEKYELRLVEEWERYSDVAFESLDETSAESTLQDAGKELYKWAEMNTDHLRIRERVTEPYVVRGSFHLLANTSPKPRVFWHPLFLKKIDAILAGETS